MGLELSQLSNLLRNPQGTIHFEHMPEVVAKHLGSHLRIVYLSHDSLQHILKKHQDLELFELLCLPFMVKDGLWIGDKPNEARLFYRHPESSRPYKAGVKVTAGGYEAYLSSFYRCNERQVRTAHEKGIHLAGRCKEMDGGWLG